MNLDMYFSESEKAIHWGVSNVTLEYLESSHRVSYFFMCDENRALYSPEY